jgi:hypothetical protein
MFLDYSVSVLKNKSKKKKTEKMNDILIALIIGIIAGTIDVIPMIIQKMDKYANLSAFFHWLVLGLIIPFVSWDIAPWLKGLIIAEISAIPVLFMVAKEDKKAIIPITVMSAILGIGVGLAGAWFMG